MTPKLHHIFPESCLLIVVGIIIGFLLFWTSKHEPPSTLTPDVFFLFMLPPIILDAGYFMPNRLFFDHLGTILLMAVVGTIFNAMCIGAALYGCGVLGAFGPDHPEILETFLFSSLISAGKSIRNRKKLSRATDYSKRWSSYAWTSSYIHSKYFPIGIPIGRRKPS